MKVSNRSNAPLPHRQLESQVIKLLLSSGDFEDSLENSRISIDQLFKGEFTTHKFNILQLAVYFQHLSAVEMLYEESRVEFDRLLDASRQTSDPIVYLLMLRVSVKLIRFFFDKLEFRNPNCKKISLNDRCVFFHIHSKEAIPQLFELLKEQLALAPAATSCRGVNIRHLQDFFFLISQRKFIRNHPLASYFASSDFKGKETGPTLSTQTSALYRESTATSGVLTGRTTPGISDSARDWFYDSGLQRSDRTQKFPFSNEIATINSSAPQKF